MTEAHILTPKELALAESTSAAMRQKARLTVELREAQQQIGQATQEINKLGPLRAPVVWSEVNRLMREKKA